MNLPGCSESLGVGSQPQGSCAHFGCLCGSVPRGVLNTKHPLQGAHSFTSPALQRCLSPHRPPPPPRRYQISVSKSSSSHPCLHPLTPVLDRVLRWRSIVPQTLSTGSHAGPELSQDIIASVPPHPLVFSVGFLVQILPLSVGSGSTGKVIHACIVHCMALLVRKPWVPLIKLNSEPQAGGAWR